MPTTRTFAYNTGSTFAGADQVGFVAAGTPNAGLTATGVTWRSGPDEDPGYIIAYPTSGPRTAGGGTEIISVPDIGYKRSVAKTDGSFITLANGIGATTFSTPYNAKTWLNSNGYWTSWPGVVWSGLILYLDASSNISYPGTGNTWYDLSGNGFDTTKNVGTFNSGGYFVSEEYPGYASLLEFTTNISGSLATAMSATSGGWCIEEWILINDTTYPEAGAGTVVSDNAYSSGNIGFDWNHGQTNMSQLLMGAGWNIGQPTGYDVQSTINLDSQFQDYGKWYLRHMFWNRDTAKMGAYYNGIYQGEIDISVLNGYPLSDGGTISWGTLYGWRHDGARAGMKIYNRVLSASEVLQNYNEQAYLGSLYRPASSAVAILAENPNAQDGYYWINTNLGARRLYCLMSQGGWMGMTSELCPQTANLSTSASWETNTSGRLQISNESILNVTVVESTCGSPTYYQLQNPSTVGLNYTQTMLLIERISTIGQCSAIANGSNSGYYDGPEYTGSYTSAGMCTWGDGNFANACCDATFTSNLKPYWILLGSGSNPSLYYQVQCAGGTGQHYHMWFIK